MIAGDLEELLRYYPIAPGAELIRHRSVWVINDGNCRKILKPLKTGAIRSFLIGELLKEAQGDQCLPSLFLTVAGRNYLWLKGNRYRLTQWVNGREADYYNSTDVDAAIRAMQSFHQFTNGLVRKSPQWEFLRFQAGMEWPRYLREMNACRRLAARRRENWGKAYLRLWSGFYDQACQAVADCSEYSRRDWDCLCYHDWAYHNLLIDGEKVYLFDFDYIVLDHVTHDKANLISRYLRLHQWDPRFLLKILWEFDKIYPWKKGELKLLRIYLMFPYDYWMFGRQLFLENLPWSPGYIREQWQRKVVNYEVRKKSLAILETLE